MLNKTVLEGHIWFSHFHFSLTRDRSQACRAPKGAGNSVVDDHTSHCHQVRAPFSSPPTPRAPRATPARLCVSHSGSARLPACQNAGQDRVLPCSRQGKQAELPYSPPDVVQHVQKGGNRKINSPKQHQPHLTSAHPCHETTRKLLASSFPLGTFELPAQPGLMEGPGLLHQGPTEHPTWTKVGLNP